MLTSPDPQAGPVAYYGYILDGECVVKTIIEDGKGKRFSGLETRQELWNHSQGFAWGYSGSGPSQLALAILAHFTGDDVFAGKRHQAFKAEYITPLLKDEWWVMPGEALRDWVEANPMGAKERERLASLDLEDVDRRLAENRISLCCKAPCTYRRDVGQDAHRAWAVCTVCGEGEEF